jgi:hypothetical protein
MTWRRRRWHGVGDGGTSSGGDGGDGVVMAAAVMAVENAMERLEAITEAMAVVAAMAAAAMAVKKAMESVVAIAEAMAVENAVEKTLAMAVEAKVVAAKVVEAMAAVEMAVEKVVEWAVKRAVVRAVAIAEAVEKAKERVATIAEEPTYRVHDLMHDMARSLIEEGILSSESVPPLELAHRQFLERYRERALNHRWDGLPNDGYIHRHLTWHLEQANWGEELHALMSMSDAKGRNAWFEACDRLGQPAIFVDDVARGWKIAERGYEGDRAGSIVLQCRYALITALDFGQD